MTYAGRYAQLYDIFYSEKDYEQEVAFVDARLAEARVQRTASLLDLACGSGRHARAFAALGYHVVAIDRSREMIERARAHPSSGSIDFRVGDMRSLGPLGTSFDVVSCLFDSIGHVVTKEGVSATLDSVTANLGSGGLFVVEFLHAPAMNAHFDPLRIRRFRADGVEILRIAETRLEEDMPVAEVTYTVYEHRDDGTFSRASEIQRVRFFERDEMDAFLGRSGLTPVAWYPGYVKDGPIDDTTWHVVGFARR